MKQADHSPMWNRTTAKVVVDPTRDLKVTVSGAYISDLDKNVATDFAGFEVHADSVYSKFGLNFNTLPPAFKNFPEKNIHVYYLI